MSVRHAQININLILLVLARYDLKKKKETFRMTVEPSYGCEGDRFRMTDEPSSGRERVNTIIVIMIMIIVIVVKCVHLRGVDVPTLHSHRSPLDKG